MDFRLLASVESKMKLLNARHHAVIFVITGPNGSGKTVITKKLLSVLPFHQTYNLGAVTKTMRYIFQDEEVTYLENFTNKKITSLFTPIVQFACREYKKNGVNVIVDGVQVDTSSRQWGKIITGGVVLSVDEKLRVSRNRYPETHFNRSMDLGLTDNLTYKPSPNFKRVMNNADVNTTFNSVLKALSDFLDRQLTKSLSETALKKR